MPNWNDETMIALKKIRKELKKEVRAHSGPQGSDLNWISGRDSEYIKGLKFAIDLVSREIADHGVALKSISGMLDHK